MSLLLTDAEFSSLVVTKQSVFKLQQHKEEEEEDDMKNEELNMEELQSYQSLIVLNTNSMQLCLYKIKQVLYEITHHSWIRQNELSLECVICAIHSYKQEFVTPSSLEMIQSSTINYECCFTKRHALWDNKTKTSSCIRVQFTFLNQTHSIWFTIHYIHKTFLMCLSWLGCIEKYIEQEVRTKNLSQQGCSLLHDTNKCILYLYMFLSKQLIPPSYQEVRNCLGLPKKMEKKRKKQKEHIHVHDQDVHGHKKQVKKQKKKQVNNQ